MRTILCPTCGKTTSAVCLTRIEIGELPGLDEAVDLLKCCRCDAECFVLVDSRVSVPAGR